MPDFTLDTSTLSGGTYKTQPLVLEGTYRDIQFSFSQSSSGVDCEPHYFEFHFTIAGVSTEDL